MSATARGGEHDQLDLPPAGIRELDEGFWQVIQDSSQPACADGYPAGYARTIVRTAVEDFTADFVAAAKTLVEDTEAYLGKPQETRQCPCADCEEERKWQS